MRSPDFHRTDEIIQAFVESPGGPLGVSYGVLRGGSLLHCNGFGRTSLTGPAPTADSVFRIASVSKSFTAAAILLLRERGRLRLTDPVTDYLPFLTTMRGLRPDDPAFSISSCLTMSAGLPTDDPWADRQESMSQDAFDDMLRSGLSLVRAPDTAFEYSNLGYAILGRIVEVASGVAFPAYVAENLLRPLGLTATTYDYRDVPDEKLVRGYRRRKDDWIEQPFSSPGAFSAIGGLLSSVQDLATWIAGMLDAFSSDEARSNGHPLSRRARLEMQQSRRAVAPEIHLDAHGSAEIRSEGFAWGISGYGYGLFVEHDPRWGEMVHHVGGYPGFSSHVRWHPSSGYGIVALTNLRYSPVSVPAGEALRAVLSETQASARVITLWPEAVRARSRVEDILCLDDAADIARMFEPSSEHAGETETPAMSATVCADVPASERAQDVLEMQRRVGKVRPGCIAGTESESPAHIAWWQEAANGYVHGEIRLTPTSVPLIQTVALKAVPRPVGFMGQVIDALGKVLADDECDWPAEIPTTDASDVDLYTQRLREARRLLGRCRIGWAVDASSPSSVEVSITGERGRATLVVASNEADTSVDGFCIKPAPVSARANTAVAPRLPASTGPG